MVEYSEGWVWLTLLFGFGVIVGSFLNVFLYRFHTGKSVSGHSHCLSCGRRLRWFELFPLLSYIALKGKCRTCHSHIPARYFLVEGATGLMFVLAGLVSFNLFELVLNLTLGVLLIITVVYDLYHFIIPDEFVISLLVLAIGHEIYLFMKGDTVLTWVTDGLVALLATGIFAGLWFISKGRWLGFGDVKLLFPLALLIGSAGVFSFLVFSFWVGALISLFIILIQRLQKGGKHHLRSHASALTIKSEVPFAPFLVIGFMLVYFGGYDVLRLTALLYG